MLKIRFVSTLIQAKDIFQIQAAFIFFDFLCRTKYFWPSEWEKLIRWKITYCQMFGPVQKMKSFQHILKTKKASKLKKHPCNNMKLSNGTKLILTQRISKGFNFF